MLFNSLEFWIFFAVFFAVFWTTSGRLRLGIALIGSYFFYGWWDWRFLGLIILLTVANFYLGLQIGRTRNKTLRKRYLLVSVVLSVGVLGFFKYCNFFLDTLHTVLRRVGWSPEAWHLEVILPVGISFYTFQAMSYTIDLYRREIPVERSLLRFATFKAFFPQLVAGPIVRAADFLPQLRSDRELLWADFVGGCCAIMWGLFLKVVVADSLATVVDIRFAAPANHSAISLAIGVLFYTFQVYGDFAGYSLIAIGVARLLGYHFKPNFDRPYFSADFSEFWRRWHISLSSWLRDYLYIPLGGNRRGMVRTYGNLMTTMLLGGLWHGASWTFVAWGGLHGLYLCGQRLLGPSWSRITSSLSESLLLPIRVLEIAVVFLGVSFAWIFFRARTFADGWAIIGRIAGEGNWAFSSVEQRFMVVKGLGLIALLMAVESTSFRVDFARIGERRPALASGFLLATAYCLTVLGTFGSNAFIYFQF